MRVLSAPVSRARPPRSRPGERGGGGAARSRSRETICPNLSANVHYLVGDNARTGRLRVDSMRCTCAHACDTYILLVHKYDDVHICACVS